MGQKLSVNGFEWIKDISSINKRFKKLIKLIKTYNKDSDNEYILKVDVKYPKALHDLHSDLAFLLERIKINKCSKLVSNLHDEKILLFK